MLLSIHMPKSGGQSFQYILEQTFGPDKIFLDYGEMSCLASERNERSLPIPTSIKKRARNILCSTQSGISFYNTYMRSRYNTANDVPDGVECIHGHYLANKYSERYPDAFVATWVRHPAQRLASMFYFWQENPQAVPDWFLRETPRLETFVLDVRLENEMHRYTDGRDSSTFDFLGITEDYEGSLALFRRFVSHNLGIESSELSAHHSNTNAKKNGASYELNSNLVDDIMNFHRADAALYNCALIRHDREIALMQEELCAGESIHGQIPSLVSIR